MRAEDQKTILLVDDEAIIAMTTKMTLEKYRYKVVIANSGEEAVAAVEKMPGIDLILMDINLGAGMDGTEAAAIILRQRDLPVVFLSCHTEPEVVDKTEKITSYGYVVKNSSITVLDASIKMAFKLFEAKIKEKEKECQRETALEALRKSEALYQTLVETSPDAISLSDQNGIIIMANQQLAKLHGYESKEELIGVCAFDFFAPEERQRAAENLGGAMGAEPEGIGKFEYILQKKDSTRFWGELHGKLMPSPDGKLPLMLTIVRDITKRKQTVEKLRESEEHKQMILTALPIAIFTSPFDPEIDTSWVSGDVEKVTGFTADQYMAEKDFWRNRLHPGDRERVLGAYRSPAAGDEIVLEYRWLCKDENYKWFYDRATKKLTAQGIQYFGIILDVTERKRAETALKESKERYENFISQISEGVYRFELEQPMPLNLPVEEQIDYLYHHMFIAECNPSLMEMYGIKELNGIIGKTLLDFQRGSDDPLSREKKRNFIKSGYRIKNIISEEFDVHGNKKYFCNNVIGIIENDHLLRLWGTQTDITEQAGWVATGKVEN